MTQRPPQFFTLHLLLVLLWMALIGWGVAQLIAGIAVGFLAIVLSARLLGSGAYVRSVSSALSLLVLFVGALIGANLQLARDILRPAPRFAPAILAFDISGLGSVHTGLLVNLVSLTPGTLSIDVDPSGRTLYVHTLYAHDEQKARREVERYSALLQRIAGMVPARQEGA